MNPTYSIILNLGGNLNPKLDEAIAKMKTLDSLSKSMKIPGKNISDNKLNNKTSFLSEWSKKYPFLISDKNLFKNINNFKNHVKIFSDDLGRYAFTFGGLRKSLGNALNIFRSGLKTIGNIIVPLGGVINGALSGIIIKGISTAVGGMVYTFGNKLLNNNNMDNAISAQMQYTMAQKGLGNDYYNTFKEATKTAAEFGFSRAGLVSAINMYTGLKINDHKISYSEASDIARIAGKIAQVGARPYDIVSLNLQQILGAGGTPNMRDIRELLHAAPIITKIAQEQMQKAGVKNIIPLDWLKNNNHLLKALYQFDELIEAPSAAVARGKLALAKENFWIKLSKDLEPYFDIIVEAGEQLYQNVSNSISSFMASHNINSIRELMSKFSDTMGQLTSIALEFATTLADIISFLDENIWTIISTIAGTSIGGPIGALVGALVGSAVDRDKKETKEADEAYQQSIKSEMNDFNRKMAAKITREKYPDYFGIGTGGGPDAHKYYLNIYDQLINNVDLQNKLKKTLQDNSITIEHWKEWAPAVAPTLYGINGTSYMDSTGRFNGPSDSPQAYIGKSLNWLFGQKTEKKAQLPPPGFLLDNLQQDFMNFGINQAANGKYTGSSDTGDLEDIAKTSKALIINFNAPVVEMPTTINSTNPQSVADEINRNIEEVVARGLTIAIHNASAN